ncbi:MAG: hypothetical protein IH594_15620, partial [Bacteroidales bacterium]|nr:hypothetical protein [Bacteroidales bacterium]
MRNLVFLIFILSFVSCRHGKDRPDIRNIEVKTPVLRFEQELFTLNPDTIPEAIDYFYRKYDDFYEIFNYYIVDLGQPSDRAYSGYLVLFIQDDLNREVFEAVNAKFGDLKSVENEFNKAFRYFRYYFPERKIPRLVSYIS